MENFQTILVVLSAILFLSFFYISLELVVHTFCSEVNGYVSTRFSGPGSTSDRGKNFHAITFFCVCVQLYGIRRLRVGTALLNLRTLVSSIRIK